MITPHIIVKKAKESYIEKKANKIPSIVQRDACWLTGYDMFFFHMLQE